MLTPVDDAREPVRDVREAEALVVCRDLQANLDFFTERLGFRLETLFPADRPAVAILAGHGSRLRLETGPEDRPGALRLALGSERRDELHAPGGTRIVLEPFAQGLPSPAPRPDFVLTRAVATPWHEGRAGMLYRDLIPGRLGGALVASLISVPRGGPVPDYVHHHGVHAQSIFCRRGWVKVAYEDQGEPIVMRPGDCVVQPPGIRHRVLECSDGLEVVEITAPADHPTHVDHELRLPTGKHRPDRVFAGQTFLFDREQEATWRSEDGSGVEVRDLATAAATAGRAALSVLRGTGPAPGRFAAPEGGALVLFVLAGEVDLLRTDPGPLRLAADDAVSLPAGTEVGLALVGGAEVLAAGLRPPSRR